MVFVVPDFEPTIGGTTRQTANAARALLARGYDALVLTQRIDRSWPRDEIRDGLRVVRVGPSGRGSVAMKLVDARIALWLARHRARIAIVHVVMYPDFAVAAVAAGLGARTVMMWAGLGDATDTLGGPRGLRTLLRWARRRAIDRRVTHVALTRALAGEVAAAFGRPSSDGIEVVPTPVNVEVFRPPTPSERAAARAALGLAGDETAVVYAGHLRALKRVDQLIDAVAVLRDQGRAVRLFVLGDSRAELDDCTDALHRQVAAGRLGDRVVFTGGVPDIRPWLRAADVFVLPSEREGLSNALLEALACGVPCVAPASAGGSEVLDDGCGAVPASGAPPDLAAAITAVTRADRHASLVEGARRRAERYSIATVTAEHERLYARAAIADFVAPRRRRSMAGR